MNYLQTINELQPTRLFTFGDYTNFLKYNGTDIEGSIFDELNGELLTPNFLPLMKSPESISIFSPSVINNEISNQGLVIGSNDIDNPYSVNFQSNGNSNARYGDSSLAFQIRVPQQKNNGAIILKDFDRVKATLVYINKDEVETTVHKECSVYGDRWFVQMWGVKPLKGTEVNLSISYKNRVIHTDAFVMNSDVYVETRIPPDESPLFSNEILLEKIGDGKPTYFGCYMTNFIRNERIMYGFYRLPEDNDIKVLPENGGELIIHGEYKEPLNVRGYTVSTNTSLNGNTSNIELMTIGKLRIYIRNNTLYIGDISTTISYNKNYNITVTLSNGSTNDNRPVSHISCYVNNKFIGGYSPINFVGGETPQYTSLASSPIRIGTRPSIRGVGTFYTNEVKDIYFDRDSATCYIDNISTFTSILSPEIVHKLYIRCLTYRELLLENPVTYYTEFDKLKSNYKSFNNSKEFISHNMERKTVNLSGEIYPVGVNFKGNGNLKLKDESTYYNTASMINFNNSFSIVMWIKTTSKDFILYSERDKQHPNNGFSIIIDSGGRINYEYGKQSYNSNCIINDGLYKMLCITYNYTTNELITYIPFKYKDVGKITPLNNSIGSHRYVTMFSDNNKIENIDVSLGALGFFGGAIDTSFYDDLFREKVEFSVSGYVAFKNLPTNAIVRVLNHDNGELITTLKTDRNGAFKYDSIYKNDVDLIVYGDDGYVQCLGTITTETII